MCSSPPVSGSLATLTRSTGSCSGTSRDKLAVRRMRSPYYFHHVWLVLCSLWFAAGGRAAAPTADVIVAADGTGKYTSLQDAISAAPMRTARNDPRWVI